MMRCTVGVRCVGSLGPRSWWSTEAKKCSSKVTELAGARGEPGVLVCSKMNK